MNLQRLGVVPRPVTHLAAHINIRQKMHLDALTPLPLARLAAAALHVEAEPPGLISADLCLARHRKNFSDFVEYARVSRRIRARRPANWALIDLDHLIDLVH